MIQLNGMKITDGKIDKKKLPVCVEIETGVSVGFQQ